MLSLTRRRWRQIPAQNSATLAYKHKKTNPNPNPNPNRARPRGASLASPHPDTVRSPTARGSPRHPEAGAPLSSGLKINREQRVRQKAKFQIATNRIFVSADIEFYKQQRQPNTDGDVAYDVAYELVGEGGELTTSTRTHEREAAPAP